MSEFLGAYETLGGEINLLGDWVPENDPETLAAEMLQLSGYLENTAVPLYETRQIAIADTHQRFATETDPSGTPWVPLDPDYLESKINQGYPEDILYREGDLERAATSPAAWTVVGDDLLVFNPEVLPDYGAYHQSGTGDTETILAFRAKKAEWRDSHAGGKGGKHLGGMGRGKNLPQRQFIGLSAFAVGEIYEAFDSWFDRGVEISFEKTRSITHTRGPHAGRTQSIIGGKFGPFLS